MNILVSNGCEGFSLPGFGVWDREMEGLGRLGDWVGKSLGMRLGSRRGEQWKV